MAKGFGKGNSTVDNAHMQRPADMKANFGKGPSDTPKSMVKPMPTAAPKGHPSAPKKVGGRFLKK